MQNSLHRLQFVQSIEQAKGFASSKTAAELAEEFSFLARYLGDIRFGAAVQDFLLEAASSKAKSFPDFMVGRFKAWSEIGELARLERSFQQAEGVRDEIGDKLRLHASAELLVFTQNTTSIWSCLVCGEAPPRPYKLDQPQRVVVWQQDQMPRFRILGDDEAKDLAAFQKRPSQKSPYFLGWLETGLAVALAK
ncbi:MAG: hypothetical protein ABIN69_01895 [Aestuariivirga sp.]